MDIIIIDRIKLTFHCDLYIFQYILKQLSMKLQNPFRKHPMVKCPYNLPVRRSKHTCVRNGFVYVFIRSPYPTYMYVYNSVARHYS